jgi:hypothetical protein
MSPTHLAMGGESPATIAELMTFFSVCHISAGFLILNTAICR